MIVFAERKVHPPTNFMNPSVCNGPDGFCKAVMSNTDKTLSLCDGLYAHCKPKTWLARSQRINIANGDLHPVYYIRDGHVLGAFCSVQHVFPPLPGNIQALKQLKFSCSRQLILILFFYVCGQTSCHFAGNRDVALATSVPVVVVLHRQVLNPCMGL